jgi:DNA-binding CsgD family transcriptional regulator
MTRTDNDGFDKAAASGARPGAVGQRDRAIVAGALLVTCMLVGADLVSDSGEGVAVWHMLVEASAGLVALAALFYLLRGSLRLRRRLDAQIEEVSAFRAEAAHWRAESRRHVEGLARAIDQQLTKWRLTAAEKEIAFLLLKVYGLKEIARLRKTSEKTVRAQSTAAYAKAGLSGRSELAAFFLEDLFIPPDEGRQLEARPRFLENEECPHYRMEAPSSAGVAPSRSRVNSSRPTP